MLNLYIMHVCAVYFLCSFRLLYREIRDWVIIVL
jgi:hypothetical protein